MQLRHFDCERLRHLQNSSRSKYRTCIEIIATCKLININLVVDANVHSLLYELIFVRYGYCGKRDELTITSTSKSQFIPLLLDLNKYTDKVAAHLTMYLL